MSRPLFCLLAVLTISGYDVLSQAPTRDKAAQTIQWFAITTNIKIARHMSVMLEGQFRQADNFEPQQYQVRTALEIKIGDNFSFAPLGYVYTWNPKYGVQPATYINNEHRIWQQIAYKHKISALHIDHRIRLEERFIQSHSTQTDGQIVDQGYADNYQTRLRYRLAVRMPFKGSVIGPKSYFLSIYDEVFVSRGKHITYQYPDQNRIFVGVGYEFEKNMTVHAGAFYQMLIKRNGAQQENNLGFQLHFTYNLDLLKQAH